MSNRSFLKPISAAVLALLTTSGAVQADSNVGTVVNNNTIAIEQLKSAQGATLNSEPLLIKKAQSNLVKVGHYSHRSHSSHYSHRSHSSHYSSGW